MAAPGISSRQTVLRSSIDLDQRTVWNATEPLIPGFCISQIQQFPHRQNDFMLCGLPRLPMGAIVARGKEHPWNSHSTPPRHWHG